MWSKRNKETKTSKLFSNKTISNYPSKTQWSGIGGQTTTRMLEEKTLNPLAKIDKKIKFSFPTVIYIIDTNCLNSPSSVDAQQILFYRLQTYMLRFKRQSKFVDYIEV